MTKTRLSKCVTIPLFVIMLTFVYFLATGRNNANDLERAIEDISDLKAILQKFARVPR